MIKHYRVFLFAVLIVILFLGCSDKSKKNGLLKEISPSIVTILNNENYKTGTGFFFETNGHLIIKSQLLHNNIDALEIILHEKGVYPASSIIAEDRVRSLIRISVKIPRATVKPIPLETKPVEINDPVYIVTRSVKKEKSIYQGVVSSFKDLQSIGKVIEITAHLPINSIGCPVINKKGKLIGIINEQNFGNPNINHAIAIGQLVDIAPDILSVRTVDKVKSETFYHLGKSLQKTASSSRALLYFNDAIRKNPQNSKAHFEIGMFHLQIQNYNWAREAFRLALLLNPNDYNSFNYLQEINSTILNYEKEIVTNFQIIQEDSTNEHAFCRLCTMYSNLGKYNQAIKYCTEALQINPNSVLAHYALGMTYIRLRYLELAKKESEALAVSAPAMARKLDDLISIR